MEQGKIMEAEAPTVRVGTTPTGLTAPPPPQPPSFFTGGMPFLPLNQQHQHNSIKRVKLKLVFYLLLLHKSLEDRRWGNPA